MRGHERKKTRPDVAITSSFSFPLAVSSAAACTPRLQFPEQIEPHDPSIKLNQSLYNQQLEHHLEHHKEALEQRSFKLCLRLCLEKNAMSKFDYRAPAELFPSRNRKSRQLVKYRRFDTAADAIQFAMEKLPAPALLGAFIEIDEARLGHAVIRELYESPDYPLKKRAMNGTIAPAPTSDA